MPETILFAIFLFALLWPFFIILGVMNFKKDPNTMEDHLPGRPARRTIGRKNEDMSKGIAYVFVGYALINIALYAFLNYNSLLPDIAFIALAWGAMAVAMFLFSPANRLMHAYSNLGHIAIVHLVSSIATFVPLAAIVYGYNIELIDGGYILVMIIGAMMIFSAKPNMPKKDATKQAGGF